MSRRYTDAEIREILAKAVAERPAEFQEPITGLSLEQIKEIGAEVGIDEDSLERAAQSVAPAGVSQRRWAGAPTVVSIERRVEGDLDSVLPNDILSVVRKGMGSPGELSELKGLVEWRTEGELGQRVITLSSAGGNTTVSGMADLGQAAIVTLLPAGLLGLIGSIIGFVTSANSEFELGMVLSLAVLPGVLLTMRRVFARLFRSESGKLRRVVDDLAALIEESAGE